MVVNEIENISDLLTRAVEGNAWHGPALFEVLTDVTTQQAAAQCIGNAHSIWEIVKHISAWHSAVCRRINGDPANISGEEDWPPVKDTSDDAWKKTLDELKDSYELLKYEILNFPLSDIDEIVPNLDHTYYVLFHGVIQHDLYHAGQIALLKKLM